MGNDNPYPLMGNGGESSRKIKENHKGGSDHLIKRKSPGVCVNLYHIFEKDAFMKKAPLGGVEGSRETASDGMVGDTRNGFVVGVLQSKGACLIGGNRSSICVILFSSLGDKNFQGIVEFFLHFVVVSYPIPDVFENGGRALICVLIGTIGYSIPASARMARMLKKVREREC